MKWPKKRSIFRVLLIVIGWDLAGCGVKGDPLPPVPPIEMGRGRPTYRRATKQVQMEKDEATDEQKH